MKKDSYTTRIIQKANELGLCGKRITEIIHVENNGGIRVNFICDD